MANKLKAFAPLRSSDRRKLIDAIIQQYGIATLPTLAQETEGENTTKLNAIRNEILPEKSTMSASFVVNSGLDERIAKGTIYVGAHPGEVSRVLWIKIDDEAIIPSVYTLWRRPRLTPLLHTPSAVIDKMREGADLNTPGLAGPPFPAAAKKGSIVAVASLEKPSVPMVVGVCEIDISDLTEVRGQKGHAVRPLHCEGDELWSWNQSGGGGEASPSGIKAWLETDGQAHANLVKRHEATSQVRENDKMQTSSDAESRLLQEESYPDSSGQSKSREWTTQEVDWAFRDAFLYGLHQALQKSSAPNHGINFPISQSQLVSNLITPYLPIFSPDDAAALQMKKTSWKTVKKFVKSLDKAQLLKSKDRNGGETVVLDIDFADQAVTAFQPYRLPKKRLPDTQGLSENAATSRIDDRAGPAPRQQLQRLALLRPKESLSPIFPERSSHHLYLSSEIKSAVTKYIENEALASPTNKRFVNLNSLLTEAIFNSGNSLDNEILANGSVSRDVLLGRVLEACLPFFVVLKDGELRNDASARPGKPPTVKVALETRSGNKTVTRLSGLEAFGIDPHNLAEELQKACASSTAVTTLTGSSPRAPQLEVMVQGPQREAALKVLSGKGLRNEWVEIMDRTKGKKK